MLLISRTSRMRSRQKERPIIDVSYVELPEKVTHRIDAGSILGGISFVSMLLAPGAVEGGSYILALLLILVFAGCAHLSIPEDGKKR